MQLNDRKYLRILTEAIQENLAEFAKEKGLVIRTGNVKYERDGTACTVQLKVDVIGAGGEVKSQYERDFEKCWEWFAHDGLKAEHLHKKIAHRGEQVELIGLRPSAPKFPLVVKDSKGKVFCLTLRSLVTIEGFEKPVVLNRLHQTEPPARIAG